MFDALDSTSWLPTSLFLADWIIRLGLSVRVIMRDRPVGFTLAWLTVILIFPLGGAMLYLMFGELRLGRRRADWATRIHGPYREWLADLNHRHQVDWRPLGEDCLSLSKLCDKAVGIPALPANDVQLLTDAATSFRALVADIDAARRTVHLEFYIWAAGGDADHVVEALLRAAGRGVICRVLVDAVGSHEFLECPLATRLKDGGVQLHAALPANLLRMLFYRIDLRMHRKIAVIDGEIAYTGSMNLVDPRFFKQNAGVGEWIDALVRLRGPAVEALGVTFVEDWELETGEGIEKLRETGDVHAVAEAGSSVVQVIPSGPILPVQAIQAILLSAIYRAREELVLTTPYFVPDELLLTALTLGGRAWRARHDRLAGPRRFAPGSHGQPGAQGRPAGRRRADHALRKRAVAHQVGHGRQPYVDVRQLEPRSAQPATELRDHARDLRSRFHQPAARLARFVYRRINRDGPRPLGTPLDRRAIRRQRGTAVEPAALKKQ